MIKFTVPKFKKMSAGNQNGGETEKGSGSLFSRFRKAIAKINARDPRLSENSFQLEMRCRGKLVLSENTANLKDITTIGKAPDNDWQVSDGDFTCAEHHAKLILSEEGMKLVAMDGCLLYIHGEQVTECSLKKDDRVAIGDSELFVKPPASSARKLCDVHRLEICSGERIGEMIRLEKSPFRIGSAPGNDLVLDTDVISLHHAEIRIAENGETWLKDLHSSNGTFVNGERLGRQERMLMDSDEISFACFDYLFLDRKVVHTRTHTGKKVLIMGITVLLVLFGFGVFYLSSPSAENIIQAVDYYLFRDNFDAAERVLAKMPESRGFQRYEKQYYEYQTRIPYYRKAYNSWREFCDNLQNSHWNEAAECYGKLDLNNPLAWNPANPSTQVRIQAINHGRELLDIFLTLRNFDSSPDNSKVKLMALWDRIQPRRQELVKCVSKDPPYLKPLHHTLQNLFLELEHNIRVTLKVDEQMTVLAESGNLEQLNSFINYLDQEQKTVTGVVRVYIRDFAFLLKTIKKNMEALERNDQALFNLMVSDVKPVSLISADECMKFPLLYRMRLRLERYYQKQLTARDNWNGLQRLLGRYQLSFGKIPEEILLFSDEKKIENILALHEMSRNPSPRISSEYDRFFGERYFYEVIQQTVHSSSNIYASDLIPDMKVVPKCILLKDLYRGLSETLVWFSLPQNEWLLKGKMRDTRDYYLKLLNTRKNVLKVFENIAARNQGKRDYYIAKAAYFFFAPATPDMPGKMQDFAAEWRKFRMRQQGYLSQYDPMDREKSRKVRDMIIADGIPGDPIFNWMRSLQ
ncbi:MAG: FHA domain-containing protein [Lentisphaeria bacterium]|nr:FHA domain-containing protein [Lentisphaeria bacterium]